MLLPAKILIYEEFHSDFKPHHSTETALVKIINDLTHNLLDYNLHLDQGKASSVLESNSPAEFSSNPEKNSPACSLSNPKDID